MRITFSEAVKSDIPELVRMRIAYIEADFGRRADCSDYGVTLNYNST